MVEASGAEVEWTDLSRRQPCRELIRISSHKGRTILALFSGTAAFLSRQGLWQGKME
jgi:hypothetical protein